MNNEDRDADGGVGPPERSADTAEGYGDTPMSDLGGDTPPPDGTEVEEATTPGAEVVEPKSRRGVWVGVAVGVVVLVVAVAAIVALTGGGGSDAQSLAGTFTLRDPEGYTGEWDSCSGDGGYSDFGPGMNVTVRDGEGNIIGSGSSRNLTEADKGDFTSEDVPSEDTPPLAFAAVLAETFGLGCTVAFEVDVEDAEFYEIAVGRRGELSYSREDLEENDWWVDLTLGDGDD